MITNLISFLYDIKVEVIRRNNDGYVFLYNNNFYIFKNCQMNEEYLQYIYNFISNNSLFHKIIKNRHNKYISTYDNQNYILMMVKFNVNRMLLLEDIYNSNNYHISYVRKKDFNWIKLWKIKVDQVAYFVSNSNIKMDLLSLSIINYYLELAELAIQIFNLIPIDDYIPLSLCHSRISRNADLYDYYSVTNIVFDHITRDLGEYIKNYIYSDNLIDTNQLKILNNLSGNERYMLLSRLIFPSYFFDIFDDFMLKQQDFRNFYTYFLNVDQYEKNLKIVIDYIIK